jgi:hypothetical protein
MHDIVNLQRSDVNLNFHFEVEAKWVHYVQPTSLTLNLQTSFARYLFCTLVLRYVLLVCFRTCIFWGGQKLLSLSQLRYIPFASINGDFVNNRPVSVLHGIKIENSLLLLPVYN